MTAEQVGFESTTSKLESRYMNMVKQGEEAHFPKLRANPSSHSDTMCLRLSDQPHPLFGGRFPGRKLQGNLQHESDHGDATNLNLRLELTVRVFE